LRGSRPFALDRTSAVDVSAGSAIGLFGIATIFALGLAFGFVSVHSVGRASVLLRDWSTWIMVPLIEEIVFRVLILGGLLVVFPRARWVLLAFSALVFGGVHAANAHATLLSVVGSAIGGTAYGLAFILTRRVWLSFGLHFGWNYAEGPLFGFPLSVGFVKQGSLLHLSLTGPRLTTGGPYGPEGGMIGLAGRAVVIALLIVYLRVRPNAGTRSAAH
jgi:membrane protease YdiL (CAAX protease family)